ncbi:fasciclin domain-containing protein [Novosphingobium sp. BW1]|uniref:fasciclin domain-containing protein n=1 Tax=Novosphingobium sp. BW1 TaxID=2592621 RepID=UPI0011DEEE78|nr:fasciclin domain-containing protein [Novosphingobium sp. BW1]TYC87461.1 fasciclin domain-containing protein [Novosphingobium sp. BW1]
MTSLSHRASGLRAGTLALIGACGLALAGCSGETPATDATGAAVLAEPASDPVPELLDDTDGMETVSDALKDTGLAGIFEGNASYTLLAPDDASFAALGEGGEALTDGEDEAAMAALLKQHLLPGYLMPRDIEGAIERSDEGSVTITSLAGEDLTFRRNGDAITVTSPDGAQATFKGEALAGGASVAIPLSGLLRKVQGASAP